jgi:hypothetical protein
VAVKGESPLSLCSAKKQGARLAAAWHFVGKHHLVGAK